MFDHVTIRASDRAASERFYDTVLATLGVGAHRAGDRHSEWQEFRLVPADRGGPVTHGLHVGFVASSREQVDEFWRAGRAAGYRDEGAPGPRSQYGGDYYGSFLLDPDANSIEAVHHGALREGGLIDHLWIRVGDLAESRRFYEALAARAGFRLRADRPERAQFAGQTGSFSLVAGAPTEHVHMAFAVDRDPQLLRDPDGNVVELVGPGGPL